MRPKRLQSLRVTVNLGIMARKGYSIHSRTGTSASKTLRCLNKNTHFLWRSKFLLKLTLSAYFDPLKESRKNERLKLFFMVIRLFYYAFIKKKTTFFLNSGSSDISLTEIYNAYTWSILAHGHVARAPMNNFAEGFFCRRC